VGDRGKAYAGRKKGGGRGRGGREEGNEKYVVILEKGQCRMGEVGREGMGDGCRKDGEGGR